MMPRSKGELEFRPAGQADWALIWPLWHHIVIAGDTYSYEPDTTSDDARMLWLTSDVQIDTECWLVETAGYGAQPLSTVGTYHLGPNHAGPGSHIANASYMVDASARGHGVGRAMVEHSIRRARALGYRGIQFNAVAATNVHAIKLYRDLGFVTVGTIPGGFRHPRQGFVDLLIMYLDLTVPPSSSTGRTGSLG